MKYVENLTKIFLSLAETGSAVVSLNSRVPEGIMVPIEDTSKVVRNFFSKTSDEVNKIIKDFSIENVGNLSDNRYYLGVWLDKDYNLNLQLCTSHIDKQEAIYTAITRSIPELIIDGRVVQIPSPQKTGTDFQRRTYALLESQKIN